MHWLALLGEDVALLQHIPYHSNDLKRHAKVFVKAAVLPCCCAYLPPHPVHDVPGVTKNTLSKVLSSSLLVVVVAPVVVNDSGVIVNNITHLTHCWAVLASRPEGRRMWRRSSLFSCDVFFSMVCVQACVCARVLFLAQQTL